MNQTIVTSSQENPTNTVQGKVQSLSSYSDEISLIDILLMLWKGKFIIIICTVLAIIIGVIQALTAKEIFSTSTHFITKTGRSTGSGNLGQLATLAGISLSSSDNIDPSNYLDKIIQDQEFITTLYNRTWFCKGNSLALEQIFEIEKDTAIPNWEYVYHMSKIETIRKDKIFNMSKDIKTGILTLSVNAPDPQLAYDLNKYTLDYISEYIRNSIKGQAKEKRLFIEERIKETKEELSRNENALVRFRERNLMSQAPKVALEEGRLLRNVTLNQEIYLQFQKQYELTKIEELDDQTLIQVVQNPEIPILRSKPKRSMIVVLSTIYGLLMGICFAFTYNIIPSIKKRFDKN